LEYPEIYKLGHAQGYPDDEITEAIKQEGADATLKFLRGDYAKKPPQPH
jgi:hypothetical protein